MGEAAVTAIALSGPTDELMKATRATVQMFGADVTAGMRPGDRLDVFTPVAVQVDGKQHSGALALFADRVGLHWGTGVFRVRTSSESHRLTDLTDVVVAPRVGPVRGQTISFTAGGQQRRVTFGERVDDAFVRQVADVLSGSAVFSLE